MEKIKVIVNGLPGKMATAVAEAILKSPRMELLSYSLTGPEIDYRAVVIGSVSIFLCKADERDKLFSGGIPDIIVDFTVPSAINENVAFYAKNEIPFILGTTGGDLKFILDEVKAAKLVAVVAPNMAKEIVAFQAMMEYAAEKFPGAFRGYSLEVVESHQKNKIDTSGTAKAVIASFNKLGVPFIVDQIEKKRSENDYKALGIPKEHWDGHGWHTYTLRKPDNSVFFQFTHNVNGRAVYISGVIEAVDFLHRVRSLPFEYCGVYSMKNVLMDNF
jgi:4-hydroxy-tetrahydrodipicolinate reductase